MAGRGTVHVLRGEQGHVRAQQVLLDSAHCEPGLQGAAWREEVVSLRQTNIEDGRRTSIEGCY